MTDYLINQYNDKIAAALKSKDDAIAAATQLWNRAVEDIMGAWQAASASAAIELAAALEHRNKVYVEGPPAPDPELKLVRVRTVDRQPFVIDDEPQSFEPIIPESFEPDSPLSTQKMYDAFTGKSKHAEPERE